MYSVSELKDKVLSGDDISFEEAMSLWDADPDELTGAADEIRRSFCRSDFDMCAVLSIRGGRCSEDCRFCPQAREAVSDIHTFPLLEAGDILADARRRSGIGIRHYCLVSSGRKMNRTDVKKLCEAVRLIRRETDLLPCASLGLLDKDELQMLKDAGLSRIHNNLESSADYFPSVCTSHTYEEKKRVIRDAHSVGLEVCSGGIIGIGESRKDRVRLAFEERKAGSESVPINMLDPVPGTPLGQSPVIPKEEVLRTVSVFRFILPKAWIRLAAGRDYLDDSGYSCFSSGSNATITGDMLNVKGISIKQDLQTVEEMGYTFI